MMAIATFLNGTAEPARYVYARSTNMARETKRDWHNRRQIANDKRWGNKYERACVRRGGEQRGERKGMRDTGTKLWKSREDGFREPNKTIGAIFWCPRLGTES